MDIFLQSVPTGYTVKLLVHDCIYLDQPLPSQHVADIAYTLRQHHALLCFEGDEIVPIHASSFVCNQEREVLDEEDAHRARIAEYELRARDYYSVNTLDEAMWRDNCARL